MSPTSSTLRKRPASRARQKLYSRIRAYFEEAGFDEVETPLLVPAPGMEPHVDCFETRFVPEMGASGDERPMWLHGSPEFAMKRLLADGWQRIFQLGKVFRNGEIAKSHNPEFTMLEFYRVIRAEEGHRAYGPILSDLEELGARGAQAIAGSERVKVDGAEVDLSPPWDRLSVKDAFATRAGIELPMNGDAELLLARARERGFDPPPSCKSFDDLFFTIFLTAIEPTLGWPRPTFLVDWPASMAALAKLRPDDPDVAERFELYIAGREIANGYYELNDSAEQRARLVAEQELRRRLGKRVYPLDERFIEAVGRMPNCAGVAVGVDRLLMILGGFESIDEVLLFPSSEEL
ncbi:EF-P lysine aminoacylase EpmA [Vulgatibacter incomptus]|uniref:Translation elongation factor P Lys34:lysine transferase n=1 Tax=Vulgatibacter incomptus TaxID=1391653 RepID=A0A0K1PE77_9BACT|nr:EF-P lysine aminoacylase EpmA [Vulgatibacter incomptus]AKU91843.1 Translation elongation factor P Lys34:lysine transferase [Vulgatibacter incomptus]